MGDQHEQTCRCHSAGQVEGLQQAVRPGQSPGQETRQVQEGLGVLSGPRWAPEGLCPPRACWVPRNGLTLVTTAEGRAPWAT